MDNIKPDEKNIDNTNTDADVIPETTENDSASYTEIEVVVAEAEAESGGSTDVSNDDAFKLTDIVEKEDEINKTVDGTKAEDFLKTPEVSGAGLVSGIKSDAPPIIEFKGVYKTYDNGTMALNDINLTINKGEFVFVVGASGAGKSTFIKLIIREETPNSGEIKVDTFNLGRMRQRDIPKLRRTMGIVYQDFRLIKDMTVYENVAFAMHIVGASKQAIRKRVAYVLNIVGLSEKARCYPNELSGGEQQRVGLARAIVNNPSIIIADEPTGNVDPNMSYEIVELLSRINMAGTTVIMVTHEHQLVHDFNKRVIMIEQGHIVSDNEEEK